MGVPALFRWLSQKYPKVTSPVVEEQPREINGHVLPVDASKPNPNGQEFDNLYLDMNGIIHPCCHPEGKPAPATEEDMFVEIFKYIDRIMAMIRPRKVLYMAIDGVAPRAKMNQQRSRRFRAAQEAQIQQEEEDKIRKEWEAAGDKFPEVEKRQHFDSNCITPGTPFMSNLAVALKYYIADRLNTDPGWRNLKVILSDASVPGEGEHKIMDYIRRQRSQSGYNPDTHHVLYGLDADLIMLALATHEPHFQILREDVFFNEAKNNGCFICGQTGHMAHECTGKAKEKNGEFDEKDTIAEQKPFVFLHVSVLREYLEIELKVLDIPFAWDLERAIDDWVFLCFFVGNDFLPHLPSLEIREGAIDKLIDLWKKNLPKWGNYLTNSGDIDLQCVQLMMDDLGKVEDEIFKERREIEGRKKAARIRRAREARERQENAQRRNQHNRFDEPPEIVTATQSSSWTPNNAQDRNIRIPQVPTHDANKAAAEALKLALAAQPHGVKRKADEIQEEGPTESTGAFPISADVEAISDGEEDDKDEGVDDSAEAEEEVEETMTVADVPIPHDKPAKNLEEEEPYDDVRLWEAGWKQRYYKNKFNVDETDTAFRRSVVTAYVEGLCWVLKYYYQGCQSWKWYFPFHYAPFASDFDFIGELEIKFELGTPFRPVEQLMGVLPAYSKQHIPPAFRPLMTDPDSPIIDFYPEKFPIDLNGKKFAWQGVALLPFIEEERLLQALETKYPELTDVEVERNTKGDEVLVVGGSNRLYEPFCALYGKRSEQTPIPIDPKLSQKFFGFVLPDPNACLPGSTYESPLADKGLPDIGNNHSISVLYYMPEVPSGHTFKADLLQGVKFPASILDASDAYAIRMGFNGNRRGRGRGRGRGGAAQRFIQHGLGAGRGDTYGRQDSYDRGGFEPDHKRPRYDNRNSPRTDSPYMGGGGYGNYSNGGQYQSSGSHQSYGGGYTPSNNYGQQQTRNYNQSYYSGSQASNTYRPSNGSNYGAPIAPPGAQPQTWGQSTHGPSGVTSTSGFNRSATGNLGWNRNVQSSNRGQGRGQGSNRRGGYGGGSQRGGNDFKPY